MPGNTLKLFGKVREKSGNFILPNLWESCFSEQEFTFRLQHYSKLRLILLSYDDVFC